MSELERLMAAKAEADAALAAAEDGLLADLADAKKAYRKTRSEANKAALDAIKGQVRVFRATVREGRTSLVGGDAFVDNGIEG